MDYCYEKNILTEMSVLKMADYQPF